jgi:hypothetical protein
MNDLTSSLLAAVVAATPERKESALLVLRGDAVAARGPSSARGYGVQAEAYVGLRDVAGFLGVSTRSVRRWGVPGHKLGSRTRYRLSEVAGYVESDAFRERVEELKVERANGTRQKGGHGRTVVSER